MVSTHSQMPSGRDMKGPPMVFSRAVATPQHVRPRSRGPPPNVSVVAGGFPTSHVPSITRTVDPHPPPVIVHVASTQSLPCVAAVTCASREMSRSGSFASRHGVPSPRGGSQSTAGTPRIRHRHSEGHASSGSGSWVPPPRPVVATPAVATSIGSTACIAHVCQTLPPQISCPVPWNQQRSFTPPVQAPTNANSDHGASLVPVVSGTSSVPLASSATVGKNDDPDVCSLGAEVVVGSHRFRCTSVLGRGSFGEVWGGEEIGTQGAPEVALKDIMCSSQSDLDQALFEAKTLETFQAGARCSYSSSAPPPQLRMTCYIAHRVDRRSIRGKTGWRVRMAMTRVPGEPLDSFLKRPPPAGQDVQSAVRRGCLLALQMVKQLAPTLSAISQNAVHRDVNAHNILLSDATDGGPFRCDLDPEEASSRARFWLIDFGLAVDATTWPRAWREADIGGDCRYWPQSSWFVSFWGADEISKHPNLCNQYVHRLDVFGLGIAALEILCTTALDGSNAAGCQSGSSDGLRGSWRRLLNAWTKYWTDVTKWHRQIYGIFQQGGGVGPLYQELAKEGIVDKVIERMATIRECLRKCVQRTEDPRIQGLLTVLADMLDESSSMGLRDVQAILGVHAIPHISTQTIAPPGAQAPLQPSAHSFPKANVSSPYNVAAAQTASFTPPPVISHPSPGSFVPPPRMSHPTAGAQNASFVPPPRMSHPTSGGPQNTSFVPPPLKNYTSAGPTHSSSSGAQKLSFVPPSVINHPIPVPKQCSNQGLPGGAQNPSFVPPPLSHHPAPGPPHASVTSLPGVQWAKSNAGVTCSNNGSYTPAPPPLTQPPQQHVRNGSFVPPHQNASFTPQFQVQPAPATEPAKQVVSVKQGPPRRQVRAAFAGA